MEGKTLKMFQEPPTGNHQSEKKINSRRKRSWLGSGKEW